jgi:hypothetical protein
MQDRRLDQEVHERVVSVASPQLSQRGELLQVGLALHADDCGERASEAELGPRRRSCIG